MSDDDRSAGFTLLEVLVTGIVFAVLIVGVGFAVVSGYRVAGNLEEDQLVYAQASSFLDTLLGIRFGRPGEAAATPEEIRELLDGDTYPGDVSLSQVRAAAPLAFALDGFPVEGEWRIEVSPDLNGDGDTDDAFEGLDTLLSISVRHGGRLVVSSLRAAPTALEEPGEANALLGPAPPADATPSEVDVARAAGVVVTSLGFSSLASGAWGAAAGPSAPGTPEAVH